MNNERFKQKMAELEKEREQFISRLTPESQQEYRRKEEELSLPKNNLTTTATAQDKPEEQTY
jgi:hypothetical protein